MVTAEGKRVVKCDDCEDLPLEVFEDGQIKSWPCPTCGRQYRTKVKGFRKKRWFKKRKDMDE